MAWEARLGLKLELSTGTIAAGLAWLNGLGSPSEGRNYSPNRMRRRDAAFIEMPVVLLVPFLRNVS